MTSRNFGRFDWLDFGIWPVGVIGSDGQLWVSFGVDQ